MSTYATVQESKDFAAEYYSSTDSIRVAWEALSDNDKQSLLNRAELVIEDLPYNGKSVNKDKAFPRDPNKELSLIKVKQAVIELALHNNCITNPGEKDRLTLQSQGVKSYKIGDLSETFRDRVPLNYIDPYSYSIVFPYLKLWLGGSYKIKSSHKKPRV